MRALLTALVLAGSLASDGVEEGPPEIELTTLRTERGRWLGREVRFTLQVDSEPEGWNPWLTRFSAAHYRGLSAWGDEQLLWDERAHADPAPRLFVRRGTEADRSLRNLRRYDRLRVRAVVREVFLDEPWIELVEIERLTERIEEGTILHAVRAIELLEDGRLILAAGELDRAATPRRLPEHVARELTRLRELCRTESD